MPEADDHNCDERSSWNDAVARMTEDYRVHDDRARHRAGEKHRSESRGPGEGEEHSSNDLDYASEISEPLAQPDFIEQTDPLGSRAGGKLLESDEQEESGDANPKAPADDVDRRRLPFGVELQIKHKRYQTASLSELVDALFRISSTMSRMTLITSSGWSSGTQ
jgi:hypothetical protein